MHVPIIELINFENDAQRKQTMDAIEPLLGFMPFYVNKLRIVAMRREDEDDCGAYMDIECSPQYRSAFLRIYPLSFHAKENTLFGLMAHEVAHLHMNVVYNWVIDEIIVPMQDTNEDLAESLKRNLVNLNESATEDLAICIARMVKPERQEA